ncbi:long-chain acyl-CoA synthetase [Paraburkholderia sp. WSM4175]|uniref:class I adenylate-forming enzyme family protein n=1 Tax=Paraburkholderia sp. WSM4175 TaxID=2991072 RepID=UPI003D1A67F3
MLTVAIRRAATVRPDGWAIISGTERTTWREMPRRIASLASALNAAGLRPGDRVATLALNSPLYFELMLAVWWGGGVLVPLNTRLAYDELRYILEHSEARFLLTDDSFRATAERTREAVGPLRSVIVVDEDRRSDMLAASPIDDAQVALDELACIFYTGGTTGLPKGVELTHSNLAFAASNMQRDLHHDSETVYLHTTPLFHLADFGIGLGVTLAAGAHSFLSHFSAAEVFSRLRTDGITHLQLVPTMLSMLLDAPERDDSLLRRVRTISYGTAPISQELLDRVLNAFRNVRIQQFYGMTECSGACTCLLPEWHSTSGPKAGKLTSVGQPTSSFEIRIVDEQGCLCETGTVGEIQIRGPAVMRGYWRDPERTSDTIKDGWLRSGDAGYMDEEGFLFVADRIKDMIISGGENIYSAEVEKTLSMHPAVSQCAVIGVPDERWGERVHAVIVIKPGSVATPAELDAHCRAHIAGYKVPRGYDIRTEPLPLSGVGKILKNRLRDEWLGISKRTR